MLAPISPVILIIISSIVVSSLAGVYCVRVVTLESIQIYNTHEWWNRPRVYFYCMGGNKTYLPDVKEIDYLYSFKGEESWQPLTELPDKKCKRCGLYEEDTVKVDDVFDEWEFCSDDFVEGKYTHVKAGEFNATFLCPNCTSDPGSAQNHDSRHGSTKKTIVVIVVSISAVCISVLGAMTLYKYWQKRKREQDQARFLKLFEEGDDLEDELDLGI
ncbi:hypothetical protein QJS04_geneDACA010518 [Acorus gramineus]|uniref:DUF7953 domain-containing protein n=1 Tax=Acorus gramineus TaxID=55184 RepID=A0AAV9AL13_ACOGR|nr:hypothetical protein QJS04_geneDACA010518 [Acorus gramineus]